MCYQFCFLPTQDSASSRLRAVHAAASAALAPGGSRHVTAWLLCLALYSSNHIAGCNRPFRRLVLALWLFLGELSRPGLIKQSPIWLPSRAL